MTIHPHLLSAIASVREMLAGDDDLKLLHDVLEGETEFREVAARMMDALIDTQTHAEALKASIAADCGRLTRFERRAEGLRDGLRSLMLASGLPSLELARATVSVVQGGESLKLEDGFECPTQLLKRPPPPEPDTAEIKKRLKAGDEIPGAWLERGAKTIRIGRT